MNTKNNKRRRESIEKIEKAFVELLQTRDISKITVSDICKMTDLNRSTFYANFLDVYDLADKVRETLEQEFGKAFADYDYFNERTGALRMFTHIKENQLFYNTYFKLCYEANVKYHIEFFRNGFNAIIKLWLKDGCKESPEEMAEVLKKEYRGR